MSDGSRDVIMDHYKHPRNRGTLAPPAISRRSANPLCGDEITLSLRFGPGREAVEDIRFDGRGCSVVLASASILTELARGQSLADLRISTADLVRGLRTPGQPSASTNERDVDALQDMKFYPARIACALLPWMSLEALITSDELPEPGRS